MKPYVSVVMPAYNSEKTIKRSVDSVLAQTFKDFELIIVDDGSEDATTRVVHDLMNIDGRIILVENESNLGVAQARNIGCKEARGEYIAFLDSDDIWREDKLEKQLSFTVSSNSDLCYTSYTFLKNGVFSDKEYIVPEAVSYSWLLKENVIGCSTVLIRAKIFKEKGYCFDNTYAHEDYALWLKLAKAGFKFGGLQEVLTGYSTGGRSSNKLKAARDRWIIYRKSENLSFVKAFYYLACYALNASRKYLHSGRKRRGNKAGTSG